MFDYKGPGLQESFNLEWSNVQKTYWCKDQQSNKGNWGSQETAGYVYYK